MSETPTPYYTGPSRDVVKPRRRKAAQAVAYGKGHYRPAPNGRGFDAVICHRYRQIRARRPDENSARDWIDAQETALKLDRPPLTRAQLLDAQDALAELPAGTTLLQAARAFAAIVRPPDSLPLGKAAALFLEHRATAAQPITLRKYRHVLKQLGTLAGPDRLVSDLREADVAAVLGDRTGRTRNNCIRHLSTFFRWAVGRQLMAADPTARLLRSRTAEPPKGVLSVDQCRALLACAMVKKPRMVPFLSIALFTGVRPGEMERLTSDRVGAQYIRLDGSMTKTSDARHVPVRPVLAKWLKAFPLSAGKVAPLSTKHLYGAIRLLRETSVALAAEAGDPALAIRAWPDDCTRHSFATYLYELTKDAASVAAELGHVGTDIFFRHYRALASPGDGARFIKITPKSLAGLTAIIQRLPQPVAPQRRRKSS